MAGGGEGSEFEVNINLTALLDVLTNLLFFLMFGAAAQQVNMELDGGFDLPVSSSEAPAQKTAALTIGRHDLRLEKQPLLQINQGFIRGIPNHRARIDTLFERLQVLRNSQSVAAKARGGTDTTDVLLVFCDKDTPYGLMHQVMDTAAQAGYAKFRMAVLMQ
jgi:biopolymer transport protein ExbD